MFLGLGCYGGKQAKEFIAGYNYKGSAANGSEQDLKALGNIPKYQLLGFDGMKNECCGLFSTSKTQSPNIKPI